MRINESVALVSGANRGIGRAFVEALLGATRVYAARDVATLEPIARRDRRRVRTIKLDVKDPADSRAAVEEAKDVNLLIIEAVQGTVPGRGTLREMIVGDDGPGFIAVMEFHDAAHIHGMFASAAYRAAIPGRLRAFRDIKNVY
jgi:NAD(P)-dependent dehydrogenase (short-subunit alcohol dehydrogenase family)